VRRADQLAHEPDEVDVSGIDRKSVRRGKMHHMAAGYAFHLAENQPFVDGKKRTALNAALVFLDINGWSVADPDERLYDAMIAISARRLDKRGLADLFRQLALPDRG
jgi:death-on-curing family protein